MKPMKTTTTSALPAGTAGGPKASTRKRATHARYKMSNIQNVLSCPPAVPIKKLSKIAMVAGNEERFEIVIDRGVVKEWVGIGWIDIGPAEPADYKKYPEVDRD